LKWIFVCENSEQSDIVIALFNVHCCSSLTLLMVFCSSLTLSLQSDAVDDVLLQSDAVVVAV